MELCDVILRTNRVRCALNMEILDLLNEESVSGAHRRIKKIGNKCDERGKVKLIFDFIHISSADIT